MTTAQQIIDAAARYIGVSGTDNIFNTWYWGYHCYDPNVYPWCAAFQSYVAIEDCDMDCNASASAAGFARQFREVSAWDAQMGDYVLFNWDGRGDFSWADHIGVVEWSDTDGSGYFGTIEGNTGNAWGGEVARCGRTVYAGYSVSFYRPEYSTPKPKEEILLPSRINNPKGAHDVTRLYNKNAGDHLFTYNQAEINSCVGAGWKNEGRAWTTPEFGEVPVYRLYNPNTGDHHYTTSCDEAIACVKVGWIDEGVQFWSALSGIPVYRLYNPYDGDHQFTTGTSERDSLIRAGWQNEGVAFYMPK